MEKKIDNVHYVNDGHSFKFFFFSRKNRAYFYHTNACKSKVIPELCKSQCLIDKSWETHHQIQ